MRRAGVAGTGKGMPGNMFNLLLMDGPTLLLRTLFDELFRVMLSDVPGKRIVTYEKC